MRNEAQLAALRAFADKLDGPASPVRKYTPKDAVTDSVIETLTVFATPHKEIQLLQRTFPEVLVPIRKPHNVRAFDTLFCDEPSHHDGDGKAYAGYGIDPAVGCVIVARPDQYVSGVFGLDEFERVAQFFDGFMVAQK